jgi:hypothetical protein
VTRIQHSGARLLDWCGPTQSPQPGGASASRWRRPAVSLGAVDQPAGGSNLQSESNCERGRNVLIAMTRLFAPLHSEARQSPATPGLHYGFAPAMPVTLMSARPRMATKRPKPWEIAWLEVQVWFSSHDRAGSERVPRCVLQTDPSAICRERKQTSQIHVTHRKQTVLWWAWNPATLLGCKRSRVQISAARPTNPFKINRPFGVCSKPHKNRHTHCIRCARNPTSLGRGVACAASPSSQPTLMAPSDSSDPASRKIVISMAEAVETLE